MKLTEDSYKILNNPELIESRNKWFQKMEDLYHNRYQDDKVIAVNGILGLSQKYDPYQQPKEWMMDNLEELATKADAIKNDVMFVPLCVEMGFYGVHFVDKILGANVYFQDGQWYNDCLETPIGALKAPDLEHDETFQLSVKAIEGFNEANVKLPLIGLPTIASALNIAVNLYGQNILIEMMTNPESAKKDLETINQTLIKLHQYYQRHLPNQQLQPVVSWNRTQPPGYGQLCGCTHQLLSPDLYKDFIAPLDNALLGTYENGGMMHLCGSHTQHLETFKDMTNLKSIQINDQAALDLEKYYNGLRHDQLIWLNPCQEMTVEKAMEITNGNRLIIADTINTSIKSCSCGVCKQ